VGDPRHSLSATVYRIGAGNIATEITLDTEAASDGTLGLPRGVLEKSATSGNEYQPIANWECPGAAARVVFLPAQIGETEDHIHWQMINGDALQERESFYCAINS